MHQTNPETNLKVLREIEGNPEITQRELAQNLGISLGKTNYCLRALIDRGWVKAANFHNSKNKKSYAYLLTPSGLDQKARFTVRFLKQRMQEYEQLKKEIKALKREVKSNGDAKPEISHDL